MDRLDGQVERTHIYHRVKWPLGSKHDCHIYEYHRPKCQPVRAESCEGRRFHLKGLPVPFKRRAGRLFWLKWDYVVNIFLLADLHAIVTQQQVKNCADRIYVDFLSADWERSRKENVGFSSSVYLWNEQMSHFSSALILFSGSTDGNWCLTVIFSQTKTSKPLSVGLSAEVSANSQF